MNKKNFIVGFLWVLYGVLYFYAVLLLVLFTNMFSWSPQLDAMTVVILGCIVLLLIAHWQLVQYTHDKIEVWLSFMIAMGFLGFGFFVLYDFYTEEVSSGFLHRGKLSPHWFRVSIFALYLQGIIVWWLSVYRVFKSKVGINCIHKGQNIHE